MTTNEQSRAVTYLRKYGFTAYPSHSSLYNVDVLDPFQSNGKIVGYDRVIIRSMVDAIRFVEVRS